MSVGRTAGPPGSRQNRPQVSVVTAITSEVNVSERPGMGKTHHTHPRSQQAVGSPIVSPCLKSPSLSSTILEGRRLARRAGKKG